MTATTTTAVKPKPAPAQDFLPLQGIDYVEFYVGNAFQSAHFYRTMFGFDIVAYRGLETGDREKTSYVLEQGKARFVLTTALTPDSEIAGWLTSNADTSSITARSPEANSCSSRRRVGSATIANISAPGIA